MSIQLKEITPDYAEALLRANTKNRSVKKGVVDDYAKQIKNGDWVLNGETIKLDRHGRLLDGQHRLMAVVAADKPIESYIVEELADDVFDSIDRGKVRTAGDILSIEGYSNHVTLAAILRYVYADAAGGVRLKLPKMSGADVTREIAKYPRLQDCAKKVDNNARLKKIIPGSIAGYCFYKLAAVDYNEAEEFFNKLTTGLNMQDGDPVHALREKLIKDRELVSKRKVNVIDMIFRAWNSWRKGEKAAYCKWSDVETPRRPV